MTVHDVDDMIVSATARARLWCPRSRCARRWGSFWRLANPRRARPQTSDGLPRRFAAKHDLPTVAVTTGWPTNGGVIALMPTAIYTAPAW